MSWRGEGSLRTAEVAIWVGLLKGSKKECRGEWRVGAPRMGMELGSESVVSRAGDAKVRWTSSGRQAEVTLG